MGQKFRTKKSKERNMKGLIYISLFILSFICTIKILYPDTDFTREYLLSSLLSESTRGQSIITGTAVKNMTTPKQMIYSSLNKIVEKNNLSVFSNIEYDTYNYEDAKSDYVEDPNPSIPKSPLVYIYNTHQLEEYSSIMPYDYSVRPNVMIASYIMREKLGENGIPAIVETNNIKEYLSKSDMTYNKSYLASEYFAREATTKYPSISYLIDVHRDSVTKEATYTEIDGKPYARVLLVTGMEHTTPGNSDGFAEALNEILEKNYPGLSRGILRKGGTPVHAIYNQNLNGKSVLLEVGGVDNKIEEVNNTMEALSKSLSEYIRSQGWKQTKKEIHY